MLPYYRAVGDELDHFEHCFHARLPLLIKGPTGCGKSRLVEHMAARLGRPLVTVACNDDTSAVDLLGRWLVRGGDTIWQDGPVARAVRTGAILYLDELAEARPDVVVVIHPLADHRRQLHLDRHDETLDAVEGFMLVVSFNPGYQQGLKSLKPSTRQRFVGLDMSWPPPEVEMEVLRGETACELSTAKRLVALASKLRGLDSLGLAAPPSTRLLVNAARLIHGGVAPRAACHVAVAAPLTDEPDIRKAIHDLIALAF